MIDIYIFKYMRELIQFGIGKCGCNISESFWSLIAKQHNIDTCG